MRELRCIKCGTALEKGNGEYNCPGCGARYEDERAQGIAEALSAVLDEQKQEAVANLRGRLWHEFNEEYIDGEKLGAAAREIRKYLPDDFFATFCELACSGDAGKLNDFLNGIDVRAHRDDLADVMRFMLKIVRKVHLLALNGLLERGREALGQDFYNRLYPALARESEKLDEEVYNPSVPRDVFVLYSSADMPAVDKLVRALEREGLRCFVSARNIRHGFKSDYVEILRRAIDRCKVAVFVSTTRSRSTDCDALRVEMEYIRRQDVAGAPAQLRADYAKMPRKYKKPRVEYVAEAYCGREIEKVTRELFSGFERCNSVKDVVRQVIELERGISPAAKAQKGKPAQQGNAPQPLPAAEGAERLYAEGFRRKKEGDLARAAQLLQEAAARGHAGARHELGLCYRYGEGVAKNMDEAYRLCGEAAEQGYAPAQKLKGDDFLARAESRSGREAERYRSFAAEWYKKAAAQGYAPAQCDLGWCYYSGYGVPRIAKRALGWFRAAMKRRYAPGMYNFAVLAAELIYASSGFFKTMRLKGADRQLRRAAALGYAPAQKLTDDGVRLHRHYTWSRADIRPERV